MTLRSASLNLRTIFCCFFSDRLKFALEPRFKVSSVFELPLDLVMAELSWRDLFFSNNPPGFLKGENTDDSVFLPFCAENENWVLGEMVDKSRLAKENDIQVFWLRIEGRSKYVGKVVSRQVQLDVLSTDHS